MEQKKTNDYGTGASEVKASVNRAVVRAKKAARKAAEKRESAEKKAAVKRETAEKKAAVKKESAEKKAATKQEIAQKKAVEKKETIKGRKAAKSGKKTAGGVRKPARKPTNVVLQYGEQSVSYRALVERARTLWRENHQGKTDGLLSLDLYVKPEEGRVYYVMNGEIAGDFPL